MTMAEIMPYFNISIHALRKESDFHVKQTARYHGIFQSTLSVRRATGMVQYASTGYLFQSTLSVRRATALPQNQRQHLTISIHALRKESDLAIYLL